MSNTSASARRQTRSTRLGFALEAIALTVLAATALQIILVLTGPYGLSVRSGAMNMFGSDRVMSVRGNVNFPVDFGDRLTWIDTQDGTRDAATGLDPVELGGPVGAELSFWSPTRSQKTIWVIGQVLAPTLVAAGIWLVFQIVRSARRVDPFTTVNEKRLWSLAMLVGVGGTAYQLVAGAIDNLLIQRSAATDMFAITATISFLPLIFGLLIGFLAAVWHLGIELRADVEATI